MATASTVDTSYTINSLTFQASTPSYTVGNANNATLTINGGGITDASANQQTLTPRVALGAAQTWNVSNTGGLLEVDNAITGTGGITKTGPGILRFGGAGTVNDFGTLTVAAGTVQFDKQGYILAISGDLIIGNANNPGATGSAVAQLNNPAQTAASAYVTIYSDGVFDLANSSGKGSTDNDTRISSLKMTGSTVRLGNEGPDLYLNAITTSALLTSTDFSDNLTPECAMGERLETSLPMEALRMALRQQQPASGLLHHSDRGSQYASEAYREHLAAWQVTPSMSRRGNCYDNAAMESFWSPLQEELVHRTHFESRAQAAGAIFDYIETFYNRERLHSALGFICPAEFEKQINLNQPTDCQAPRCPRNRGNLTIFTLLAAVFRSTRLHSLPR